jgi:hypothetical protein
LFKFKGDDITESKQKKLILIFIIKINFKEIISKETSYCENLYGYKWINGKVEKTKRDFNTQYLCIYANFHNKFYNFKING